MLQPIIDFVKRKFVCFSCRIIPIFADTGVLSHQKVDVIIWPLIWTLNCLCYDQWLLKLSLNVFLMWSSTIHTHFLTNKSYTHYLCLQTPTLSHQNERLITWPLKNVFGASIDVLSWWRNSRRPDRQSNLSRSKHFLLLNFQRKLFYSLTYFLTYVVLKNLAR